MAKEFGKYLEPGNPLDVLVVDGLNLSFRWKHMGAKEFSDAYINTVKSLAKSYNCGKIIICSDFGSSSFRKDLYPDYKGNREILRAKQTDKERQDFEEFLNEYEHTLQQCEAEGFLVLKYHKVEADDIAAFIVKNREAYKIDNIWLISSDKDWDLLISDKVSRFSYVTRKETTVNNWREHYDFEIEDYITFKCLTGDSGDHIPGISGVGPKRAVSLMEQFGDVFEIYNSCPIPSKYKYIQAVNQNADQLLLNVELMDLLSYCDEAIGFANTVDIADKVGSFIDDAKD